jgi:hypothetical protein
MSDEPRARQTAFVSRRLLLKGAVLVPATAAGLVAAWQSTAFASYSFPNSEIVAKAESYPVGYLGGQCKVWVEDVVNAVLAANGIGARVGGYGSPGGAYYGAYADAGGTLIGASEAQPGDVVQFIKAAQKNSDYPSGTLHTVIIVGMTSTPGTYMVRDCNNPAGSLRVHADWAMNPLSWAASHGVSAYFWRFGSVGGLEFIKTKNTGSGKVELLEIPGPDYKQAPSVATPTWFSPADANNGWFQLDGK